MFRRSIALIGAMAALAMVNVASAQVFPNAPWNKKAPASHCPAGGCPDSQTATSAGHWTHPGTISNHLEGAHGVPTNGMNREQMLDLHDALHEGRAPAMKQAVPYAIAAPAYVASSYGTPQTVLKTVTSYGSSGGGFAVGKRDADGAVITSIGSTVSPEIAKSATQAIQPLAVGDRVKFRRVLLTAAKQARDEGDISAAQYFLLSAASRSPKVLDQIQAALHEQAIEEGLATPQAIDWDALLAFIEKLIPIIIQLIDLFS